MKHTLVVRLPLSESTDFDALIGLENGLMEAVGRDTGAAVDGHEIAPEGFSIFISSENDLSPVIGRVRAFLEFRGLADQAAIEEKAAS